MSMQRNLLYNFVLQNFAMRFHPGAKAGGIFSVPGPLNDLWPEPYKTATLGYEASWAGVFTDLGREGG